MHKLFRRRPSGAMIVAVIALVAAVSGVAIADPLDPVGGPDGTHGVFKMFGTPTGATATLFRYGPFTVTMRCTKNSDGTHLQLFASSREPNSVIFGQIIPTANTPDDLQNPDLGPETDFNENTSVVWDMQSPSGHGGIYSGTDGVNSLGADCWVNWTGDGR